MHIYGGKGMKNAEFQLETLTCPSCIQKIESVLNNRKGILSAKVLFNSSKVKMEFDDSQINTDQIENSIGKLGYRVLKVKSS
ncbi:MAG: heavy-metal-associated domain-containing protein [Proteiniphilum sp.]|nr:heavy-metal-associated domain-containing protein [Proteiniphilum sp.]MEA4918303.1 heavy-metal-associated domain-containing protein [Proteiniphilum sp.]